jgi:hypothetical protein
MGNINPAEFVSSLIIYMVVWIFAVSAHEAAHAWMSLKYGDDTAYLMGRVTLNPLPHIDPIGTLLLPIIGFVVGYVPGGVGIPLIMWGQTDAGEPVKVEEERPGERDGFACRNCHEPHYCLYRELYSKDIDMEWYFYCREYQGWHYGAVVCSDNRHNCAQCWPRHFQSFAISAARWQPGLAVVPAAKF